MGVAEQYRAVRAEVDAVCRDCGRDPAEVLLVSVSKTVGTDKVGEAVGAGAMEFGENRPDQLLEKHAAFPQAHWHFIGNVQSRRIADIVSCAHLVHSVFKLEHLPKFDAAASKLGRSIDILLEINSGEEAKGGLPSQDAPAFLEAAAALEHVNVRGLMTMAPRGNLESARRCFDDLRRLRDSLEGLSILEKGSLQQLSMGMSEDWPAAIKAGATIIRVGRAVFSADFA